MWQSVITYAIVAAAAIWVAWSVLLPRHLRVRIGAALRRPTAAGACGCDKR